MPPASGMRSLVADIAPFDPCLMIVSRIPSPRLLPRYRLRIWRGPDGTTDCSHGADYAPRHVDPTQPSRESAFRECSGPRTDPPSATFSLAGRMSAHCAEPNVGSKARRAPILLLFVASPLLLPHRGLKHLETRCTTAIHGALREHQRHNASPRHAHTLLRSQPKTGKHVNQMPEAAPDLMTGLPSNHQPND